VDISLGDVGEDRKVSIMIEQKMEFDRTFGLFVLGPVEDGKTEVNN